MSLVIPFLIRTISLLANLFVLLVIVDSIVSYFLSPYHPVRSALDRIVSPMLAPIRRVVPLVGMFDLSPLVLIVLIEILSSILISVLNVL
jgi:YggT family protein